MKLLLCLCAALLAGNKGQEVEYTNVVEAALATPELSTVLSVLTIAGLEQVLQQQFLDVTVFAPTNDAISDFLLDMGVTLDELTEDLDSLTSILLNHVVPTHIDSSQLLDGMQLESLNEAGVNVTSTLTVAIGNDGDIVIESGNAEATIIESDLSGGEGVIHIIDAVLVP
eukprot:TRINITY_DN236_c2_g1_i1.p2 TRINITY_DN236_c2_g1~~TRINITY_DN236_c2_g1_i1.p2  ORF type:complete len:170 (-),score=35.58 TRINITY_DN236_c2_g1_i1:205-714(-)